MKLYVAVLGLQPGSHGVSSDAVSRLLYQALSTGRKSNVEEKKARVPRGYKTDLGP